MVVSIERLSGEGYQLKIQGSEYELNVHMTNEDFTRLENLKSAFWDKRASIKAGMSANANVFWAYDSNADLVSLLVGHDDETWDFAVSIPAPIMIESLAQYISIKD